MMKKRSEFGLGSAFFGISDPGLVKKTFFKVFFPKKLTRGSGDEILEIFLASHRKNQDLRKNSNFSRSKALSVQISSPEALVNFL